VAKPDAEKAVINIAASPKSEVKKEDDILSPPNDCQNSESAPDKPKDDEKEKQPTEEQVSQARQTLAFYQEVDQVMKTLGFDGGSLPDLLIMLTFICPFVWARKCVARAWPHIDRLLEKLDKNFGTVLFVMTTLAITVIVIFGTVGSLELHKQENHRLSHSNFELRLNLYNKSDSLLQIYDKFKNMRPIYGPGVYDMEKLKGEIYYAIGLLNEIKNVVGTLDRKELAEEAARGILFKHLVQVETAVDQPPVIDAQTVQSTEPSTLSTQDSESPAKIDPTTYSKSCPMKPRSQDSVPEDANSGREKLNLTNLFEKHSIPSNQTESVSVVQEIEMVIRLFENLVLLSLRNANSLASEIIADYSNATLTFETDLGTIRNVSDTDSQTRSRVGTQGNLGIALAIQTVVKGFVMVGFFFLAAILCLIYHALRALFMFGWIAYDVLGPPIRFLFGCK